MYLIVFVLTILRNHLVVINVVTRFKRIEMMGLLLGLIIMMKRMYFMHAGGVLKV